MCSPTSPARNFFNLRHRWEMPMIRLSLIITLLSFALAIGLIELDQTDWAKGLDSDAHDAIFSLEMAILLPLAPAAIYLYRFFAAAVARSNSILIGPKQFPELFAVYQELGRRLEMAHLPRLYLTNGNGVVNAYALSCNRRHNYVVIHSEIALLLPTSPEIVEFVLAHELAHHKLGHVSLWRIIISLVPNTLVLPGRATTRAQEYSADRVAMAVCPHHASSARLLAVGPWLEKMVNPVAWNEQCTEERGEFFVRIANALSTHAVLVKRFKALKDIESDGFSRHGDMF